jgi:replicative DNA helicase
LYRPEYYKIENERDENCELIVAKNRHGKTGSAWINFFPESGIFKEKIEKIF